jgi:hypothetical protein
MARAHHLERSNDKIGWFTDLETDRRSASSPSSPGWTGEDVGR